MRTWIFPLLPCLALAAAEATPPAWQAQLSPSRMGKHPRLAPVELHYSLTWKGLVDAGEVTLVFGPRGVNKPGMFVVNTSAHSKGTASRLFPYSHHFWAELHHDTLRPRLFVAEESDRKERSKTTNRYAAGGGGCAETPPPPHGRPPPSRARAFEFKDVHDLFSAMLLVRSRDLSNGERISLVVMPFMSPYLLQVETLGREIHHGRPAIKLSVGMRKIDTATRELRPYKKLNRSATLWLSDDAQRVPLELRADVFIGDVRAVLTRNRGL